MSAAAPASELGGERVIVSVVVPARDAATTLASAVTSALSQRGVDEVVLAVGPSRDGTEAVAARLADEPRVRVVDNPSGRTPDALNLAVAAARGEVIVRLDAHAVLPDGYVARAVDTLERTDAANVGGRQVPTASDGFAAAVADAMASPYGAGGATYRSGGDEGPVDTVYLGVFRRSALEAVGGFDAAMTRNQDAELNIRLRAAGLTVWFDPHLEVAYRPRGSVRALARQYVAYGRWRRATLARHPRSLKARQLAAPAVVLGLLGAAVLGLLRGDVRPPVAAGAAYLTGVAAAGTLAARTPRRAPATALALATMHLAWGAGFLAGPPRAHRRPSAGAASAADPTVVGVDEGAHGTGGRRGGA